MAEQLIESMAGDWDPSQYHDEFRERLQQVLNKRIKSKGGTTRVDDEPAPREDASTNVVDFMALLQKSLDANKRTPAKKAATRKATAKSPVKKAARRQRRRLQRRPHPDARRGEPCRCTSIGANAGLAVAPGRQRSPTTRPHRATRSSGRPCHPAAPCQLASL